MTLDESHEVLRRIFGEDSAPRGDMTWREYCAALATIAAMQAKRLQELESRVAKLEGNGG